MKKTAGLMLGAILLTSSVIPHNTEASVGVISVTTNVKNKADVTAFVKNNDNKNKNNVTLEFQKDGKTISKKSVKVNQNQQLKTSFKMSAKGKYRIKYTFKGKYSYTTSYTK